MLQDTTTGSPLEEPPESVKDITLVSMMARAKAKLQAMMKERMLAMLLADKKDIPLVRLMESERPKPTVPFLSQLVVKQSLKIFQSES
jgi:hypothetical protein